MNRTQVTLIVTLLMHVVLFFVVKHTFSGGSDFQIIALVIFWAIMSVIAIFLFHKAVPVQSPKKALVKLGYVILCLIALVPLSFGGFLLFLAAALHGADFR